MLRELLFCTVVSGCAVACTTRPAQRHQAQIADAGLACPVAGTASRISAKPGQCESSPGRSYTRDQIDRTGQTNVGDALQLLDPAITVQHR